MIDEHIHNGDAGIVAQCLQCGHDFTVTYPDEPFCTQTCASNFIHDHGPQPGDTAPCRWAGWTGRICACGCGASFTATWAEQTRLAGHEGKVPCSHCGRPFEPSDGRNTVCSACRRDRQPGPREQIKCGGCGRMFMPKDGREKYCPVCAELPIAQRKNQMRVCPTCGRRFFPEHGPQQLHCRQECAWPAAWNGPQVGDGTPGYAEAIQAQDRIRRATPAEVATVQYAEVPITESSVMPQNS